MVKPVGPLTDGVKLVKMVKMAAQGGSLTGGPIGGINLQGR